MDLVLVAALALALGFILGVGAGTVRALRLAAQRRALAGAAAGIGRFSLDALPTRSAADILSGVVRVRLGGQLFMLPVLARRPSADWLASLDARFAHIAAELDEAADDKPRILALLAAQQDDLLAMLRAYDQSGVLPDPEFIDDFATDAEVLAAIIEVWRAASPLAATLAAAADEPTAGISPASPMSSPSGTAGDLMFSPTD